MEMKNLSLVENDKITPINAMTDVVKAYFEKHKGMVTYAFFTTYDGRDISVLEELLCLVPGGNKVISEAKFDVCCGAKKDIRGIERSYLSQLLLSRTHRILVNNAFHPKIMMFYYKLDGEEQEKILLIIGSKNLTRGEYLDAYVCFEGKCIEGAQQVKNTKKNGPELSEILMDPKFWGVKDNTDIFSEETIACLEDIKNYHFELWEPSGNETVKPMVSFCRPSKELLKEILSDETDETETIVVSPFVTDEAWETKKYRLYTTFTTARALQNIPKESMFFLGIEEPSLHAKLYIKHSKGRTKVWIGSSNFTKPAFSDKNSEILACLTYEDEEMSIYKTLSDSFKEQKNGTSVWQKTCQDLVQQEGVEQIYIPVRVYKELEKQLKVINIEQVSEDYECEYTYDKIQYEEVKNIEITPRLGKPTRNGCVSFVYIKKDKKTGEEKEQIGYFTFDLISKIISDEKVKATYEKILGEYIKQECQEYNRCLLNPHRKASVTKGGDNDSEGEDSDSDKNTKSIQIGQGKRKRITLFDLIFQMEFTTSGDAVKTFLSNYKNSYIGELPEKEAQLIELYLEEKEWRN